MVCQCGDAKESPELLALRTWRDENLREPLFSSAVIYLAFGHNAVVDWIGADQWFGIQVKKGHLRVYVECDLLEDGIAAICRYLDSIK